MWNLTPDYLSNVKEELKGRRAAIQARYANEVQSIETELEEIETLERAAYAFAVKHLPEAPAQTPEVETKAEEEPEKVAAQQDEPANPDAFAALEPVAPEPKSGMSRWRARLDTRSHTESA